ncbi:uncharacterized protein MICPUCDRAFT_41304 [Micromonas pusilla CCMP1545]|uniref:Predicted protein n=1 Tax=Micromonas pusilla (strain CCMP1545) TaxID=564608 RepID=C1MZG5_MICPC|nr:uncharacterized protein MICPUCDRAFT_41304 [Micromonas pusilla CCMP1545]EEH54864.1 predicted protein [Micromonas pusilla CCMP1545]|eukprot:XP_003061214.1 predicted protein [Micromonas pusilla CCMP1545]
MTRAKERLVTWDNDRLRREGYALFGLSAMREGVLQRDVVVRLLVPRGGGDGNGGRGGPPLGAELPFHRFAQGDVVSLVEGSEHDVAGANSVQGVVVERAMHFLKIAIDEEDELKVLNASKIRVDLSANTISHDRALAALVAFSEAGGMPDFAKTTAGTRLSTTGYAPLQRALIGIPDGGGDLESIASPPPPWGAKNATPGGLKPLLASKTSVGSLNPSQRAAVNAALSRTLTTWQGPPGTGKTRTLMAFIESVVAVAAARGVLKRGGDDDGKAGGGPVVLACAASNVAVDNIVEGLVRPPGGGKGSGGMRVVRLGSPAKVQPWLLATTVPRFQRSTSMRFNSI